MRSVTTPITLLPGGGGGTRSARYGVWRGIGKDGAKFGGVGGAG